MERWRIVILGIAAAVLAAGCNGEDTRRDADGAEGGDVFEEAEVGADGDADAEVAEGGDDMPDVPEAEEGLPPGRCQEYFEAHVEVVGERSTVSIDEPLDCVDETIAMGPEIDLLVDAGGTLSLDHSTLWYRGDITVANRGAILLVNGGEIIFADDPYVDSGRTARHRRLTIAAGGSLHATGGAICADYAGAAEPFACRDVVLPDDTFAPCSFSGPYCSLVGDPPRWVPPGGRSYDTVVAGTEPVAGRNRFADYRFFEFEVSGELRLEDSHVKFAGVRREVDEDHTVAFINTSWLDTNVNESAEVYSGIQIRSGATVTIGDGSVVAYGELHGIFVAERIMPALDFSLEPRVGPPTTNVTIDGAEIRNNGLAGWCHGVIGGDGIVVVDEESTEAPTAEYAGGGAFPPDPCGVYASGSKSMCTALREGAGVPDQASTKPFFTSFENPPGLLDFDATLAGVISACLGSTPAENLDYFDCVVDVFPYRLELAVRNSHIHHNGRGGFTMQSILVNPTLDDNDIHCNGMDVKDPYGRCEADTGDPLPVEDLFLKDDEFHAGFDGAYFPYPDYDNDLIRDIDADDWNDPADPNYKDRFVPYYCAINPSVDEHPSYGIYAVVQQVGQLRRNVIQRHRGYGAYNSRGGSWNVEANDFRENKVGFRAACVLSRLMLTDNELQLNGTGLAISFNYIADLGFWTNLWSNAMTANDVGLMIWNTHPEDVYIAGDTRIEDNAEMGAAFIRASFEYPDTRWRRYLTKDYVPVQWVCRDSTVRVANNDVLIAGQVEVGAGCDLTLDGVASWTYLQDKPLVGPCDLGGGPRGVRAFVDADGDDASSLIAAGGADIRTDCRNWIPMFCRVDEPECIAAHPSYPACCPEVGGEDCRARFLDVCCPPGATRGPEIFCNIATWSEVCSGELEVPLCPLRRWPETAE